MRKFRGFQAVWAPAFEFALALMALMLIIAVTESPTQPSKPTAPTIGYYAITQTTPDGNPNDVDLYVRDPKGLVAYFASQSVDLMNLEFDVIPGVTDTEGNNLQGDKCDCERTIIRGIIPGEYVVDTDMYDFQRHKPEQVTLALWSLGSAQPIVQKTVTLFGNGSWKTGFRFTLNAAGKVTNISTVPLNIIAGAQDGTLG